MSHGALGWSVGASLQLQPVEDPGTLVVVLAGAAMLGVLSIRLTYLALRTRRRVARPESALWEYFAFAGVVGILYGGLELLALWTETSRSPLDGVLLAFALLFALAMREGYYNAMLANAERDRIGQFRARRTVELAFVGAVVVATIGPLFPLGRYLLAGTATAAVLVVGYGLFFEFKRSRSRATRGTLIDSLLRQSVPVLVFAGGALVAPVLVLGGTEAVVARAISGVFVVVTAASLMTVTLKLSQHLSTHR